MLDHPFGHEAQLLLRMNFPASQAEQNVAPAFELVPLPQGTHAVLFDSSAYVLAAHSLHSNALEYFPALHGTSAM